MKKYDILFISPHLDDVVYSCSQLIKNINDKRLHVMIYKLGINFLHV